MIKQIKMGIQTMRYTYGIGMSVAFMIMFLVLGILLNVLSKDSGAGNVFILVTGMWPVQLINSLPVSGMVQTSPWKKALETSVPALVGFASFLLCYLLVLVFALVGRSYAEESDMAELAGSLIMGGAVVFFLMVYCGFAYKFFVSATMIFIIVFLGGTYFLSNGGPLYEVFLHLLSDMPLYGAILIGLLEIAVGALVQYGISLLVYRKPMSKKAQIRSLQKYM